MPNLSGVDTSSDCFSIDSVYLGLSDFSRFP